MVLPENFASLHQHEESIRQQSIELVEAMGDLALHADAFESAVNALNHFTHGYPTDDQDKLMIQLLGIRLFNAAGASLKLLLSGYYQTAAALMRDMLETANLIDYFGTDPSLVSAWRTLDDKERWRRFKPAVVRDALGTRDGADIKKRRDEIYKVFSTFASHPTPKGFRMLRRTPDGLHLIGPFFETTALSALLTEAAKTIVPAAMHLVNHFACRTRDDHATAIAFLEMSDKWSAHFFGTPYDAEHFIELRRQVAERFPAI